jgi:hypothetical protein
MGLRGAGQLPRGHEDWRTGDSIVKESIIIIYGVAFSRHVRHDLPNGMRIFSPEDGAAELVKKTVVKCEMSDPDCAMTPVLAIAARAGREEHVGEDQAPRVG